MINTQKNYDFDANILFIHGGPGLNSRPEQETFTNISHPFKYHFWHEISEKRDSNYPQKNNRESNIFEDNIKSILFKIEEISQETTKPILLLGHSYATKYLLSILSRKSLTIKLDSKIQGIILAAPAPVLEDVDEQIFKICLQDFESHNLKR